MNLADVVSHVFSPQRGSRSSELLRKPACGRKKKRPNGPKTGRMPGELDEKVKCASCGVKNPVMKRCTRCQAVFYCSRECQVKHWKAHKFWCGPNPQESIHDHEDTQDTQVLPNPLTRLSYHSWNCADHGSDAGNVPSCKVLLSMYVSPASSAFGLAYVTMY